ncbi:BppU family phage baseplate upper protein [Turicibacter sanguinis]|uniref:BppU family phage baseplate upper protein n=1 Tax=Turicibacter sanguinis TaxID=154288 RepID=UPI0024202C1A|nr:BppU family phage baseplate upper protein [Turicibacter sanguinis]
MKPKAYYFDINKKMDDTIHSVQFDKNSRFIEINFLQSSQSVDLRQHRATIRAIKPDNTEVFNDLREIDASIGRFELELTEQLNAVAGDVVAQLEIYGENESLFTTNQFTIEVSKSLSRIKTTSSDELGTLVNVLAEAQQYKNNFIKMDAKIDEEVAKTNAQLSKKANSLDVRYKSDKILLSDLSTEVKETMTGGSVGVVGESSVNFENLTEDCVRGFNIRGSRVGRNKLDVMSVTPNYTVNWQNGEPLAYDGCAISDFIPCLPSTAYYYSYRQNVAFYDNNKVYISGIPLPTGVGMEFITPDNARYIRVGLASTTDSQGNKLWNTFYLCELNELQEFEPYVESSPYEYDLFQKENSSITIEKDNRGRIVNIAETIGNKTTNTYISYGENGAISNITENNGEYESTITVSKNLIERKVKTLKGVY